MVRSVVSISLLSVGMMGLSGVTLTNLVPWVVLSLGRAAIFLIGKAIQQHTAAGSLPRP